MLTYQSIFQKKLVKKLVNKRGLWHGCWYAGVCLWRAIYLAWANPLTINRLGLLNIIFFIRLDNWLIVNGRGGLLNIILVIGHRPPIGEFITHWRSIGYVFFWFFSEKTLGSEEHCLDLLYNNKQLHYERHD